MEMLRRLSLRNAGIEIVKRTITEEYPEKGYTNQWNNNDARNANDIQLHGTDALNKNNVLNGRIEGESKVDGGNDDDGDDYVVIELLDEEPSDVIDLDENYVDIGMKSSKQILLYPAKKEKDLQSIQNASSVVLTCVEAIFHRPHYHVSQAVFQTYDFVH